MSDFHPRHVIDRLVPDRTGEVAALRSALTAAEAEAAHWRAVAEQTALGLGRLRRERDEARAERDREGPFDPMRADLDRPDGVIGCDQEEPEDAA